jgi:DNA-binding transcriptional LysR family regulator
VEAAGADPRRQPHVFREIVMGEPFKNLSWDDFRLIKAIADVRSLPAAAVLLGINHSTVIRRLGQIEEALGAKLFERHRSGYTLTTPGEEMVALTSGWTTTSRPSRARWQDGRSRPQARCA